MDLTDSSARAHRSYAHHATTGRPTFFWIVLGTAAAFGITGDALQALLHDTALTGVAAAVAIFPSLTLLAATHRVSMLLRAHAGARATHWIATAMTALIAMGAFWLSYNALRSLAVTTGVPSSEAWLWPLVIEGSMAQSTVALLALAHSAHGNERASGPSAELSSSEFTCAASVSPDLAYTYTSTYSYGR
ncbi:DUF2637 domain-containing protein [Nocardia sp. NBC_00508]|uniref:DUF2637 domain-containing protein n=1 Tax=Nocardia sp. NBC_00508 TaxID=2975992 RepID=UPI002E80B63A|nr:DUF2637 domain-containing protein [Nocardia sp. NBC_00508]WUD68232.1 DUF2637 domain-containing protein [Nocardia sp. NBC_00508]